MQDNAIYQQYKPLRNAICKLCLVESLGVIRAYIQDLQFGSPIPRDCEVDSTYSSATSKIEKIRWISEYHLETLCREILIHAVEGDRCSESLKSWSTLSRAINKLKELEEFISGRFKTPELLLQEMHRIVHRQFPWQRLPSSRNITRYYLIYKHPSLEKIIQETFYLSVDELLLMGMALLGSYSINLAIFCPPSINIPGLSEDTLDRFLERFSIDLSALKGRLKDEQQMNDKFSYAYSSLRAYPVIKMTFQNRDSLICPLPTLLFWRFTSGVYYEICGHESFANAFGEAFQWYAGEVIKKGIIDKARVYPEENYNVGKDLKRTVDWVLDQDDAAIFLEAKTKRLSMDARTEGISGEPLSAELEKMATMLFQVYKSIRDYRENFYPSLKFNNSKQIYPIVVTLEEWFLMGPKIKAELDSKILAKMQTEGIPDAWLTEMPYTLCSIDDLETAVQIFSQVGIDRVLRGKAFNAEKQKWLLSAYIKDSFHSEMSGTSFLFDVEYNRLGINRIPGAEPG